jgi:hypothetical protein
LSGLSQVQKIVAVIYPDWRWGLLIPVVNKEISEGAVIEGNIKQVKYFLSVRNNVPYKN